MALVVAVREYEGGGFDSFLKDRVRAALLNAVERQSMETKTARKMVDRVNRLQDISAELAEELGREATVEELAKCFLARYGADKSLSYGRCQGMKSFNQLYDGLKPLD